MTRGKRWWNENAALCAVTSQHATFSHFLTIVLTFGNLILFDEKERDYVINQINTNTDSAAQLFVKSKKKQKSFNINDTVSLNYG